jgi:sugar/nucleoside kinase (ribokinase family)
MPALDGKPFAAILAEARRRGLVTGLDTVFDATGRWERVLPSLEHVDLFTPALAEARGITGEDDPAQAAAWLRARGVGSVAITLGREGCYASGPGFEGHVTAPEVTEVDGTGSGDAFAAGLFYGRLAGWDLERSARFACAAGALATTAIGAYAGVRGEGETSALARGASSRY